MNLVYFLTPYSFNKRKVPSNFGPHLLFSGWPASQQARCSLPSAHLPNFVLGYPPFSLSIPFQVSSPSASIKGISHPATALHLQHLSKFTRRSWVLRSENLACLRPGLIFHFTLPLLIIEASSFCCEKVCQKFFYNPIMGLVYFKKLFMYRALRGSLQSLFSAALLSWSWIPPTLLERTR